MAISNQVREAIGAVPFRPFVVRLSDGRSHKVEHPEFAMLAPSGMELLFVGDDQGIHQIMYTSSSGSKRPAGTRGLSRRQSVRRST